RRVVLVLGALLAWVGCTSGGQDAGEERSPVVPEVVSQASVNACAPTEQPHRWESALSPAEVFGGEWQLVPAAHVVAAGIPRFTPKEPDELPYGPVERLLDPPFGRSRSG